MIGGEEKFQERATEHLIPCIAQFAVAMADDSLWKPLNYQILLKMRHASPKVYGRDGFRENITFTVTLVKIAVHCLTELILSLGWRNSVLKCKMHY